MRKAIEVYGEERKLEGRAEGRAEGRVEGKTKRAIETAKTLKEMGMDISFIAQALKVTSDVVIKWLGVQQV